jgi:glycerophosphoryl diester phosphodiesterase
MKELYSQPDKIVVTAHRGFSARYPENTLYSFAKAIEAGADIIEFDLRETKDGVPVVLHDPTLDRTTDGSGPVTDYTFEEIKKLNASFWDYQKNIHLDKPACPQCEIPAFEEVLKEFAGKTFMNIQVYTSTKLFSEICRLYKKYNMYEQAFFMMPTFEDATLIRKIDPQIKLCVGEARHDLDRHKKFGVDFIQPQSDLITPEFCDKIQKLELCANMFCSNSDEDNRKYLERGIRGIMTDNVDIIVKTLTSQQS